MSKRKAEGPPLEGGREAEEEEEEYQRKIARTGPPGPPPAPHHEYHYEEAGPSHRMYQQPEHLLSLGEPLGTSGMSQPPSLRTRGPGRPRIHPPKPAGVSRPRGRPKGSKNKKPRKRIERPPKRPRGRPRKWPPEMWEGFQRTREAAVQQQLKQQHQQQIHQQQHQEMPGPSHMYMEQQAESAMGMQQMPGLLPHHHMQHPALQHHQQQQQQQQQQQPHMPQYMQMPLETEQPQEHALVMPRQTIPQELMQPQQQMQMPSLIMPGGEEHSQEVIGDPEELLWMQQLPPEDLPPPHSTTS